RSVAQVWQPGFTDDTTAYPFNLELSRQLLNEAGYEGGFEIHGLVSEESVPTFLVIKELFSRIGVTIHGETVPRPELLRRAMSGECFEGDFLVMLIDNPVDDPLFSHMFFLSSEGPLSLAEDPVYDTLLQTALTAAPETLLQARRNLEHYVADEAMMIFTNFQHVYAAARPEVTLPLPRSGHFNTLLFWDTRKAATTPKPALPELAESCSGELGDLLEATSHKGIFFAADEEAFEDPVVRGIWTNLKVTEKRWRLQSRRLMRKLIDELEARDNFNNILESTQRAAIVGYSIDGRRSFVNVGYRQMIGDLDLSAFELIDSIAENPSSREIRQHVDRETAWTGSVIMPARGKNRTFHLAVTEALDETFARMGYTLVFSDISGEEERIRSKAIRDILENVPYGLLMVNREHRVLEGYSSACDELLVKQGPLIEGETIESLLGLRPRDEQNFFCHLEQVFDDILPQEVLIDQIPERIRTRDKWISVSASPIREDSGQINRILFSLLDINELVQAEIGQQHSEEILQVLMHKTAFASFVRDLDSQLVDLASETAPQTDRRRLLHTAKGVFGQFSIGELVQRIHQIEDAHDITVAHLEEVRTLMRETLAENELYWSIRLEDEDDELVVSRSILREIQELVTEAQDLGEARRAVSDAVTRMEEKPVSEVVGPIKEACESHAKRRNKEAELTLIGGDIRVPEQFLEAINTITHLVRNAVDHGIEACDQRGEKPSIADIRVLVDRSDTAFTITVTDDGRGIDDEALVARAMELNLLDARRAGALTHQEKLNLIFADSLSTAPTITETSGRGVGMAAVRETVEGCGGRIVVHSTPGRGSRFDLSFPINA
ncbi:MAG: ATP-binding protein, partial [Planctomycetota bacterium]